MDSQQARPEQGRARANTGAFSFRSHGSGDSPNANASPKSKHARKESDSERRKTHYDPSTKANPNAAMNEAQPMAAALEKPTLQSLRSFQHSDADGNLIAEPDLSNPTRSRWERPLDTIRSFEAAIDGEYRRRASQMRSDQTDVMSNYGGASRRSSYYGGGPDVHRNSSNSYHATQQYVRPPRDSYDNGYGQGGPVGGPPRVRYGTRMQSDPGWGSQGGRMSNGQNVYNQTPPNGYQQSRDTVHTNGSNGSHSDAAYGTDPSSENSSIERSLPVRPPQGDMGEQYRANGYTGPIREEYGPQQGGGYFPTQPPQQLGGAPPPPPHAAKTLPPRLPIQLGGGERGAEPAARPSVLRKESTGGEDKRKSWFKRRFSKN
ncbi:uncharacterized protein EKO05_0001969 [Ascochyta rabiei]|uniref:uncharacterized protein n=1 Tax=Didymella rabiei TaxID=5454 RepID=UPI00220FD364|nr:uncharacterized protein EKO05_0001969 [Ascochyta rabiei]UPX11363.1 hypothetical protein EKO05_0001969 [Ascochyta rabiei]